MVSFVCRNYAYKLYDIYQLSWRKGGLTRSQLSQLYDDGQKQLYDDLILQAKLHGATFEGEEGEQVATQQARPKQEPLFPDVKQYAHLPEKERKEITEKLMNRHKQVVGDGKLLSVKKAQ